MAAPRSILILLLLLTLPLGWALAQSHPRIDTLVIPGCTYLFEGYPESFFLKPIPGRNSFVLTSENYRGVILETVVADGFAEQTVVADGFAEQTVVADGFAKQSTLRPIAQDPMTAWARTGKHRYDYSMFAFSDSLCWFGNNNFLAAATIPRASGEGCTAIPELPPRKKYVFHKGTLQAQFFGSPPLVRQGDTWRLYLATRLFPKDTTYLDMESVPPFLVLEMEPRGHSRKQMRPSGKKWKYSWVQLDADSIPLPHAARDSPYLYGFTYLAQTSRGIWWSSVLSPTLYLFDLAGRRIDSLRLATDAVKPEDFYSYNYGVSNRANWVEAETRMSYYHVLMADDQYIIRLVHRAPGSTEVLVHSFARGRHVVWPLPVETSVVGYREGRLYFRGFPREGQVVIPWMELGQLFETVP